MAKRLPPPDLDTPVHSKMAIDRLIDPRDAHLRDKTLWRMLYETCDCSDGVLDVNIEDLDVTGHRCPVKAGCPAEGPVPRCGPMPITARESVRRTDPGRRPLSLGA